MSDNYLEDVPSPAHRKTIRQIPIPEGRRTRRPAVRPAGQDDVRPAQAPVERDEYAEAPQPSRRPMVRRAAPPVRDEIEPEVEAFDQEDEPVATEEERSYVPPVAQRPMRTESRPSLSPLERAMTGEEAQAPRGPRNPMNERFSRAERRGSGRKWLAIGAVVVLLVAAITIPMALGGAEVRVMPRTASAPLTGTTTLAASTDFEYLSTTITETETLPATTEENVSRKASGQITIYNDFSAEPQELVATTRFRTADGLIFRIAEGVTVPGNTSAGTGTKPGSIQATVYADEAGEEYNIGASRFNVPGFEGSPRYSAFYAESSAPMTGGFAGQVKTITEAEAEAATERLNTKISAKVLQAMKDKATDQGFILSEVPEVSFAEPQITESGSTVTVSVTATVRAAVASKEALSKKLAAEFVPGYDGAPILVTNLDDLDLTATVAENESDLDLKGAGDAQFVWQVRMEEVKAALAGRHKDETDEVLTSLPGVASLTPRFSPFWKRSYPTTPADIEVILE